MTRFAASALALLGLAMVRNRSVPRHYAGSRPAVHHDEHVMAFIRHRNRVAFDEMRAAAQAANRERDKRWIDAAEAKRARKRAKAAGQAVKP
jgi:hypothetical protein